MLSGTAVLILGHSGTGPPPPQGGALRDRVDALIVAAVKRVRHSVASPPLQRLLGATRKVYEHLARIGGDILSKAMGEAHASQQSSDPATAAVGRRLLQLSSAASGGENVEPFGLQSVWEMLRPIAALPEKAVAAGSSPTSYPVLSSKLRELNAP